MSNTIATNEHRATVRYFNSTYSAFVTVGEHGGLTARFTTKGGRKLNVRITADHVQRGNGPGLYDAVTRFVCAQRTFQELLDTDARYSPTIDCQKAAGALLADFYDRAREQQGDHRRAFRRSDPRRKG